MSPSPDQLRGNHSRQSSENELLRQSRESIDKNPSAAIPCLKSLNKLNVDRRGSYISSQLTVINDKLQLLYDEIGISDDERNTRERNLYAAVSQTLEQHVVDVTAEKDYLYKHCLQLQEQLTNMMAALQDVPEATAVIGRSADAQEICAPLIITKEELEKKNEKLQGLYSERYERARGKFKLSNYIWIGLLTDILDFRTLR